ncbi:hypothetical protein ABBQ32_000519 [Trebouxia sp. C0010 RCD-2024]
MNGELRSSSKDGGRSPSSSADQEALVDVPLSFELSGFEPLPNANRGGQAGPSAKWYHAAFHTITAVVGVGVLGLPYSFSYLGWVGGVFALVATLAASLYTAYLLSALHEEPDGTRHNRYVDLGRAILGDAWAKWLITPLQYSVMIGLAVAYLVTAGQSFQAVHNNRCNGHTENTADVDMDNCKRALTGWIILFGGIQLLLSQVKDFHSLWWVSLLGAAMSVMYSMIAFVASAVKGHNGVSFDKRSGSAVDRTFGTFNSFGTIMFAFGGQIVMPEIQLLQGFVLQIFAQPVFENVETLITEKQLWPSSRPRLMRAVVRSLYVALTTFVAICLPFFADLMGLIGAAGFTPMTFILPCIFWIKARKPQGIVFWVNIMIIVVYSLGGLLAAVGSIRQIVLHARTYNLFH